MSRSVHVALSWKRGPSFRAPFPKCPRRLIAVRSLNAPETFLMTFIYVQQVDSFLQKLSSEVDHKPPMGQPTNIVIVTDGQLPLRQCLLPETCSKGINDPPAIFGIFYDLRKEFRKGFPNAPEINSIQEMINCKSIFFSISRLKCPWVFCMGKFEK